MYARERENEIEAGREMERENHREDHSARLLCMLLLRTPNSSGTFQRYNIGGEKDLE